MIRRTAKSGFTLIELLVAMGLAVVLLALAIGVSQSTAFDSYKTVGAADRLTQWMIAAKSKALRDKAPRGIRLLVDPATGHCREIAYIEQPDHWAPTNGSTITANSPRLIIQRIVSLPSPQDDSYEPETSGPFPNAMTSPNNTIATRVFLINIPNPTGTIEVGDLLHIPELGQPHRITAINTAPSSRAFNADNPAPTIGSHPWPPAPATPIVTWNITQVVELELATLPDLGSAYSKFHTTATTHPVSPAFQTASFSVQRRPRPIMGEPTQQLPNGMIVDFDVTPKAHPLVRSSTAPNPYPQQFDILYSPSGEVIGLTDTLLVLALRDVNVRTAPISLTSPADLQAAGNIILVCLYTKTGAVATQPINPPPAADPYRFAKDAINTGL